MLLFLLQLLDLKQDLIQGDPVACVMQAVNLDNHNGSFWPSKSINLQLRLAPGHTRTVKIQR